jgi:hypothetical protein
MTPLVYLEAHARCTALSSPSLSAHRLRVLRARALVSECFCEPVLLSEPWYSIVIVRRATSISTAG